MKVFCGTHSKDFATKVAFNLQIPLGKIEVGAFRDNEVSVVIGENVRNQNCVVIQNCCNLNGKSVNDSFMEVLIIADALKRGSANKVIVVMPYYCYSRSDRKDYSRAPISASVIANCLQSVNIDRVITYDLHAGQIAGFFDNKCPLDNLYNEIYFIKYINEIIISESENEIIIVAPDEGGMKTATRIANKLNCEVASIYKQREKANEVATMKLMGDVSNKIAIIVDDMIDTAGTATKAATILKEAGAHKIYMIASHGLLSGEAINRINRSSFEKVVITNTITPSEQVFQCRNIDVLDVSWLCAEAILRQENGESLKELYSNKNILEEKEIRLELVRM
jgi:ribose-phosphate pyrophosphokinase